MSTYGGDSFVPEAIQRDKRVKDLFRGELSKHNKGEVRKDRNGRYVCLVCPTNPLLDTMAMFYIHQKGRKHQEARRQKLLKNKQQQQQVPEERKRRQSHKRTKQEEGNEEGGGEGEQTKQSTKTTTTTKRQRITGEQSSSSNRNSMHSIRPNEELAMAIKPDELLEVERRRGAYFEMLRQKGWIR
ncbi:Dynein heavy chain, variant 3 [Balamuthia mandrillaris]